MRGLYKSGHKIEVYGRPLSCILDELLQSAGRQLPQFVNFELVFLLLEILFRSETPVTNSFSSPLARPC